MTMPGDHADIVSMRPLRYQAQQLRSAPVAQLDRALPSEGRGREFESRRVRQISKRYQ